MASADLTWMLIKDNSSFLVRRRNIHRTFSREANNLRRLNTFRDSGLAQTRTVAIAPVAAGGATLTLERQRVSQLKMESRFVKSSLPVRTGPRHAARALAAQIEAYRPDLLKPALARLSKTILSQRKVKESPKRKLGRRALKKAKAAKATAPAELVAMD